jgi:hypothetical protein
MAEAANPHIAFPFRLNASGTGVIVTEQDSDDDIMDCVEVLLSTELGEREEVPSYGMEDPAFRLGGIDEDRILDVIARWEPRAERAIEAGEILNLAQRSQILITGSPDG